MAEVLTAPRNPLPQTAAKAEKLVAASQRATYDPFTTIDWSVPVDDTAYHLPPEFLPLFGTDAWNAMTEEQRIEYSRHECASLCGAGIWFENILMQLVLKHLYDLPADDPSHRYLLIETADECRHSAMFGEYIRQAGTPAYRPPRYQRLGGAFMKATSSGPEAYIAILAAEELLDISNRATMKDDRIHPVSKSIAKLHVLEEARHVSFARTYITEVWPTLNRAAKLRAMIRTPFFVSGIAMALVNPAVYRSLGIEGGAAMARKNPLHRERVARDLGKLAGLLSELGIINGANRWLWRAMGLVPSA
jgi:hypothetical protein